MFYDGQKSSAPLARPTNQFTERRAASPSETTLLRRVVSRIGMWLEAPPREFARNETCLILKASGSMRGRDRRVHRVRVAEPSPADYDSTMPK